MPSIGSALQISDIENEYALIFPTDFYAYDKRK